MNTDFIKITGLSIYAYHGVLEEEKKNGQTFYINANCFYDMKKAAKEDYVDYAANYASICETITNAMQEKQFDLIEAAAEYVAETVLQTYPILTKISLELCKPSAPIGLPFENVSVNIERGWHQIYVAVGSNLGESDDLIAFAKKELEKTPYIKNLISSKLIYTKPYGVTDQPAFLNGAFGFATYLDPEDLLDYLHEIEKKAGRERILRWGPRTLDLDIIFYDDLIYESSTLIIPHVDMQNRDFVLRPLTELAPNLRHPITKKTMTQMLNELKTTPRMILFDVDGTLIDSSEGITKSALYTLEHYGIKDADMDTLLKFIGPPLTQSFEKYYGFSKEQAKEAVGVYRERYEVLGVKECSLYPGVKECLAFLKEKGYLIGMASSKPETTCIEILTNLGVAEYFDEFCGATKDGRINTKEEVLNELFRRHPEIDKSDLILIGDTIFDIEGANQCGIKSIGVSFGFGDTAQMKSAGALTIVDSMKELEGELIKRFPL